VFIPVKHDAFVADLAAQRFAVYVMRHAGHVPGVFQKHAALSFSMLNVNQCTEGAAGPQGG
jgi:hypothetical protein